MKKLLLTSVFLLSSVSALATCRVDLIDVSGRVISSFRSNSSDHLTCMREALKECNYEKRMRQLSGSCSSSSSSSGGYTQYPNDPQYPSDPTYPSYPHQNDPYDPYYPGQGSYGYNSVRVGDVVIPDNYNSSKAKVVAMGYNSEVMVKSTSYYSSNERVSLSNLAVTTGCLNNICVGDKVIPSSYSSSKATVVGINFAKQKFVVKSDSYYGDFERFSIDRLAATKGCIRSICVGEKVYTANSRGSSTVKAVNVYSGKIVIQSDSYYSSFERVDYRDVFVTDSNDRRW